MSVIYIEPTETANDVRGLIQAAIEGQIAKLELGLAMARKRLAPFEQKYGVTSEHFISEMAAEDLEGGDDEYVHWAGEYKLMQRLYDKLRQLQRIEYRA
jgi:hypothetical protein